MAVRIRSLLVSGPIVVPLNTGQSVRLSAGQASDELPDVEVAGNAKVDKLRRQGAIDVEPVGAESATPGPAAGGPVADGGTAEPKARTRKRAEPSG
jgi:hypothetical protein